MRWFQSGTSLVPKSCILFRILLYTSTFISHILVLLKLLLHTVKTMEFVLQVFLSVDMIMGLYATGLFISDFPGNSKWGDSTTLRTATVIDYLLDNEDGPHILTATLDKCYYNEASICRQNEKFYMLSYFSALKFLCQPLAEFFNSERKEILAEIEGDTLSTRLCRIQDLFHQLCEVFLFCHR